MTATSILTGFWLPALAGIENLKPMSAYKNAGRNQNSKLANQIRLGYVPNPDADAPVKNSAGIAVKRIQTVEGPAMLEKTINQRDISPPKINLSRHPGEPPFMVDMEGFFEFSFDLAEALLDLEARYSDPNKPQLVRK